MDTVQQEQSTTEKKSKIPLVVVVVLLLLLSPLGAFFLLESYLEKTIYEDRQLIIQYEAEEALEALPFSSVTKGFLSLVNFVYLEYFNHYYLLPSDVLVEILTDYDYTESNGVFEVLGQGKDDNTLRMRVVLPPSLDGFEVAPKIECSVNSTVAGEVTTSTSAGDNLETGSFPGYDKELEVQGRVSDFTLSLLERPDVQSSQSRVYMKGLCSDFECTSLLDNCVVEVVAQ